MPMHCACHVLSALAMAAQVRVDGVPTRTLPPGTAIGYAALFQGGDREANVTTAGVYTWESRAHGGVTNSTDHLAHVMAAVVAHVQ